MDRPGVAFRGESVESVLKSSHECGTHVPWTRMHTNKNCVLWGGPPGPRPEFTRNGPPSASFWDANSRTRGSPERASGADEGVRPTFV